MGYLYFTIAAAVILLFIFACIFLDRIKEKFSPRLRRKPKSPGNKARSPGPSSAAQRTCSKGKKYIPSYQSNPKAVKHVERFLQGAITRGNHSKAEQENDADEDAAGENLLGDKGLENPAGEKDEKEAVKAQEPVQLELGMKDCK